MWYNVGIIMNDESQMFTLFLGAAAMPAVHISFFAGRNSLTNGAGHKPTFWNNNIKWNAFRIYFDGKIISKKE